MTSITADTTDTQIAVRAAIGDHGHIGYYPDGAPPERCVRLLDLCRYLDRLPEGDARTRQAWVQARESFDRLTEAKARAIVRRAEEMEQRRAIARRQRHVAQMGRAAKPHQAIVDRLVELGQRAQECPAYDRDDWYVEVIRSAYPEIDDATARAISTVVAHRIRAWYGQKAR